MIDTINHIKNDKNMVDIIICNFNTSQLVNNLIKSIFNNIKSFQYNIIVLDNSDKYKFKTEYKNIKILDNTEQQLINYSNYINFDKYSYNNFASAKHCISIQYLLENCNNNDILLFDSDTVLLCDIDFIDTNYCTIGTINCTQYKIYDKYYRPRILPYIQYFNKRYLKNIKYFDKNRMLYLSNDVVRYDTGSSFYEDVLKYKLPIKNIDYNKYIYHIGGCSWEKDKNEYRN